MLFHFAMATLKGPVPGLLPDPGFALVVLNVIFIALSLFFVLMVVLKLWLSLSDFEGTPTVYSPQVDPLPMHSKKNRSSWERPKLREQGRVTRKRERVRDPAAAPSHAINISINTAPDSQSTKPSTVAPQTSGGLQQSLPKRKTTKRRNWLPEPERLDHGKWKTNQPEKQSRSESDDCVTATKHSHATATARSSMEIQGFERVIAKRNPDAPHAETRNAGSNDLGKHLVEMNRKIFLESASDERPA